MRFIRALADFTDADIPQAGGKAVQCGRLRREGFAVPDGFCVLVDGWGRPDALKETEEELSRRPAGVSYAVRSSTRETRDAGVIVEVGGTLSRAEAAR